MSSKVFSGEIAVPQALEISSDALAKRGQLVSGSKAITSILSEETQILAVQSAREIRSWVKEVEETRVELTKPLLDLQRLIKSTADGYCAPLVEEQKRVEKLVTVFQEAEAVRVAKEEAAAAESLRKSLEAQQKAQEAADKALASAKTDAGLEKAIAKEDAAILAQQKVQELISAPLPTVARSKGAVTRRVLRWEVTDINALVKARPELCKIEPKNMAIQALCVPEMPNPPPGLKLWWENQTTIRSY